MQKWISFRSLQERENYRQLFQSPVKISEHLNIRAIPEKIRHSKLFDSYISRERQRLEDRSFAICAEYEASALEDIQYSLNEELAFLPIVFWLARAPLFVADEIVHCHIDDDPVLRHMSKDSPIFVDPQEDSAELTSEHLSAIAELYNQLRQVSSTGTVKTALWSLSRAIKEQQWPLRFLLYWICLEGLFGPQDGELTYRISQRMSLFLSGRSPEALKQFSRIKQSYGWRCKVVHGMHLSKLKPEQSMELMGEIEALVRSSLVKALSSTFRNKFDSSDREPWLDSLAFAADDAL